MPTVIRKTREEFSGVRRDIFHALSWQVRSTVWNPPTDVYETENAFVVRMEIAGMREENFDVSVRSNTLYITGSRPDLSERRAYHQMEIPFGKFAAMVELPGSVDVDTALAEYVDGFLTITLPKITSDQDKVE